MSRAARVGAVLVLAAILLPALAAACPLCKDAEADTPGGTVGFGRGIYYSILLMIAVPWTAVGTVAFLIIRKRRREGPARERQSSVAGLSGPQGLSPQLSPQDLSPRLSPDGARP